MNGGRRVAERSMGRVAGAHVRSERLRCGWAGCKGVRCVVVVA